MRNFGERGLTLIELMIALGISSIAILVTVSTTANVFQTLRNSEMRNEAGIDFMMLSDFFSKRVPSAGGPNLTMGATVVLENNCASRGTFPNCQNADRLSLIYQRATPNCTIDKIMGQKYRLQTDAGVCCLINGDFAEQQVMLIKGSDHSQIYVRSSDYGKCEVDVAAGPLSFNDSVTVGGPTAWEGAQIVPVEIETYYVNPTIGRMFRYRYTGGSQSNGTNVAIADRILDFQVAGGYDFFPNDGGITEDVQNNDEWLHNRPGQTEVLGVGHFASALPSNLRMLAVGFVVGAPAAQRGMPQQVQILNGPLRTADNMIIRGGVSKFGLRTLFIFQ